MIPRFASQTTVSGDKTKGDIENYIRRHGATQYMAGRDDAQSKNYVMFRYGDWNIRFTASVPKKDDRVVTHNKRNQRRTPRAQQTFHEQLSRSVRRQLFLCIKAKLESIASGIETFEEAFLAHIVLADGTSFGDLVTEPLREKVKIGYTPTAANVLALGPASPSSEC